MYRNASLLAVDGDERYEMLRSLLMDSQDLEKLTTTVSDFNIFEAIGMVRQEIRHSCFLATLLNPRENHGLGVLFFEKLMSSLLVGLDKDSVEIDFFDIDLNDYSDLVVIREQDRIDILMVSERNKQLFVIENKIDAKEHGNQLERYQDAIRRRYPNYEALFIFLTLDGSESSEGNWLRLSYTQVIACLKMLLETYGENMLLATRIGIEHYIVIFERHFFMDIDSDSKIAELCYKIYTKHKKAIDLIIEHCAESMDGRGQRMNIIEAAIGLREGSNDWVIDSKSNRYLRYAYRPWDKHKYMHTSQWTKSKRVILFEIDSSNQFLDFRLIIGPSENQSFRDEIFNCIIKDQSGVFRRNLKQSPQYTRIYTSRWLSNKKIQELDDYEIEKVINRELDKFFDNDWPAIGNALDSFFDSSY